MGRLFRFRPAGVDPGEAPAPGVGHAPSVPDPRHFRGERVPGRRGNQVTASALQQDARSALR